MSSYALSKCCLWAGALLSNRRLNSGSPLPCSLYRYRRRGGSLDKLWRYVNISETERHLVLAWILESLRAETPKPVLALSGAQGNAKSSAQNMLRQLIDNNSVNLRAAPKSTEDVFVSAGCNWIASFNNISRLTSSTRDALCTLATGGGFAARTLYTNAARQ
jgi:hypothetical protein